MDVTGLRLLDVYITYTYKCATTMDCANFINANAFSQANPYARLTNRMVHTCASSTYRLTVSGVALIADQFFEMVAVGRRA